MPSPDHGQSNSWLAEPIESPAHGQPSPRPAKCIVSPDNEQPSPWPVKPKASPAYDKFMVSLGHGQISTCITNGQASQWHARGQPMDTAAHGYLSQ
jgi:hypothetical protein